MRKVGIKLLKNKLSEYVRAAEAGETLLITDRDRVVAELRPPEARLATTDENIVAAGVREGWLTPALASRFEPLPDEPVPPGELSISFERLMYDLARDREDR